MDPRDPGSQPLFAAATVMRPATKELPSREPATTKHTKTAAMILPNCPKSPEIAVFSSRCQMNN